MNIEITENGFDTPVLQTGNAGIALISRYGTGTFDAYQGKGFTFWNNRYLFSADSLLKARADLSVLELHITRSGVWKGEWDGVTDPDLHPGQFNLTYTPHVLTLARFRKNISYHSCDIYFELSYLQSLATDYSVLEKFLDSVSNGRAGCLVPRPHHCTRSMITAANDIIQNPFGHRVQPYILETKVRLILLEALEKVALDLGKPLPALRSREKNALHHVKELIEHSSDTPLTHSELSRLSGLNECTLKRGFRLLFGQSPYQYHLELKMKQARELLLSTREPVECIAFQLGYSQASSFGHEFKKFTGLTPGQYRKHQPS